MFKDNPDFYPTDKQFIKDEMLKNVILDGMVVYEPQAGSGNIIDVVKEWGAGKVLASEKDPDLAQIAISKCDEFIEYDIFDVKPEMISHIDFMIANPPFSNIEDHLLHMIEIAPPGCRIISLCDANTLDFRTTKKKKILRSKIDEMGDWRLVGKAFHDNQQRKTDVEIAIIDIKKTGEKQNADDFTSYFDLDDKYEDAEVPEGLTGYNPVKAIVSRYVNSVKMFKEVMKSNSVMNDTMGPIAYNINFNAYRRDSHGHYITVNYDEFRKHLQLNAWTYVFSLMNIEKYLTSKVKSDLRNALEQQKEIPFTMNNIYKMFEMVVGTQESRMKKVISDAFDQICSFAYSNSTGGEGWKTNSDYKVNKKFIKNYMCEWDPRWPKDHVNIRTSSYDSMDDIVKALCFIQGLDYNDTISLNQHFQYYYRIKVDGKYVGYKYMYDDRYPNTVQRDLEDLKKKGLNAEIEYQPPIPWGQWTEWTFFRIKGFKKGTMHFEFLDDKLWEKFNRLAAEAKGWRLPKQTDRKTKGTERTKEKGVEIFFDEDW